MIMEINEAEGYLGLLREKQAIVQRELKRADEQIGIMCDALHSDGITEHLLMMKTCPPMRPFHLYPLTSPTSMPPTINSMPIRMLYQTHPSQVTASDNSPFTISHSNSMP